MVLNRIKHITVKRNEEILSMLRESRLVYDQALYFLRQSYFKTKEQEGPIKTPSFMELYRLVRETETSKNIRLYSTVEVEAIKQAFNAWKSYIKAVMSYNNGQTGFTGRPKIPGYKHHKTDFNVIKIQKAKLRKGKIDKSKLRLPKSSYEFGLPKDITLNQISYVNVYTWYDKIRIEIQYSKDAKPIKPTNPKLSIGVDLGINNLMAITTNGHDGLNRSWLVKGGHLKSINQYYNKKAARLRSINASKQLNVLDRKRTHKINYALHKASRQLIDLCLENGIGSIVIGKNPGWKTGVNLSKVNNQKFVQIPHSKLIDMITYKALEAGISVKVVEESYTSKTDHLSGEAMNRTGQFKGKRVKRGLFKSSTGKQLNADINGAIGILRKGKAISDGGLTALTDRGDIVSPLVLMH